MNNGIPNLPMLVPAAPTLDGIIAAWLAAKEGRSQSAKTRRAYEDALTSFRHAAQAAGLDLDGHGTSPDQAVSALALLAQGWAATGMRGTVKAATFNQRLAILSSFYAYARRQGLLAIENPIGRVERRPTHAYAEARALDATQLRQKLATIDRATLLGKRDYALLVLLSSTGNRLSEIASLEWRDVEIAGDVVSVTFRRVKGGKTMRKVLPKAAGQALLTWLYAFYGAELGDLGGEKPLWVSLSSNGTYGRRLDGQSVADICARRLGVSKAHALRHTFAMLMEKAGAQLTDIQAQLGHANAATTGIYLKALKSAENPYGEQVAALLGLG